MTPADPEPRIRKAIPADVPEMVAALTAAFPEWPPVVTDASAADYLLWKMSPRGGFAEDTHTLVDVGGRIAALQLRWLGNARVQLPAGPTEYVTDTGADLAVHPDFRGRGLARAIAEHERERLHTAGHLGFDTPSHAEQVQHMARPGQAVRTIGVWVRPLTRLRSFAAAVRRVGRGRPMQRGTAPDRGPSVEVLDGFDARADELWERVRDGYDLIRMRDAAYLRWRYAPPGGGGQALGATEGERLLGLTVVKPAAGAGLVLELHADPAHSSIATQLLEEAASRLRDEGCERATCWLPVGHHLEGALEAAGFALDATRPVHSDTVRLAPIPEVLPLFRDPDARFHMTMGDFDFV
jgi:GNAT superfamily N-acetyltransferase